MNRPLTAWPLGAAASLVAAVRRSRPMCALTLRPRRDLPVGRTARLASFLVVAALLALALPPAAAHAATFTPASTADLIAAITTANTNGTDDIIDLGGGTFTLMAAAAGGSFGAGNGCRPSSQMAATRSPSGTAPSAATGLRRRSESSKWRSAPPSIWNRSRSPAATSPPGRRHYETPGHADAHRQHRQRQLGQSQASGGINNGPSGTVTLTDSTVSGNTGDNGAGIYSSGVMLTLINSTVNGNSTGGSPGGGIFLQASTATITNSTFSGNSAPQGGGIFTSSRDSLVTLTNSTFSGNSAGLEGGGILAFGGTINLRATIFDTGSSGANCALDASIASFVSLGSNVADDATCFPNAGTDKVVANNGLLLGPLAGNGGPTLTHALLAESGHRRCRDRLPAARSPTSAA